MNPRRTIIGLLALLSVLPPLTTIHAEHATPDRASLMTVEGIVRTVETLPAATGGDVTAVRLAVDKPEPREITVLLAPETALRQTGFEVEVGDRVRARLFLTGNDALDYRMVWLLSYRVPGRQETWEGRIDARTGAVIGFRDTNVYGQATGGVFPRSAWLRDEVRAPLPFLRLSIDGTKTFTDAAGRFTYDGGEVRAGLNGRNLRTKCVG